MFSFRRTALLALGCALLLSACGGKPGADGSQPTSSAAPETSGGSGSGKVLNLYIWSDYLAPNALSDFEKQTGIKVHVSYFDTTKRWRRGCSRVTADSTSWCRPRPISSARSRPACI